VVGCDWGVEGGTEGGFVGREERTRPVGEIGERVTMGLCRLCGSLLLASPRSVRDNWLGRLRAVGIGRQPCEGRALGTRRCGLWWREVW
jgi:hypothetical protein